MNEKIIFSILKIEPTKDENSIKNAYRNLLVNVNPEEDQEGFKELRKAYEDAINYARTEEEEKKTAETPVEIWMEKVKEVYAYLSLRTDLSKWKEILSDEICQNLDSSLEARSALLGFLSSNYRLKNCIWRLIGNLFCIQEEKEALYEEFPPNFINYIIYHCNEPDEDDFSYELFEGEDNGDIDTFLYQYTELSRNIDDRNLEEAEKNIRTIQNLTVSHPLLNLEKARLEQEKGNQSLAVELVRELLLKYKDNLRVLALGAEVFYKAGDYKKAAEYFEETIEKAPNHYLACKRLAHYYWTLGEYKKAKQFCECAMSTGSQEEELLEENKKINDSLIEEFEKTDEEDFKQLLETGWYCLENGYYKKGINFACDKIPTQEHKAEHSNLLGRLYLMDCQYEKAIEYTKIRLELIKEDAGKEEKSENDRRMGTAYELWTQACLGKVRKEEENETKTSSSIISTQTNLAEESKEKKKRLLEEALEKIDLALSYEPDEIGYLNLKVRLYLKLEKFSDMIKVCDEMEKVSPNNFWANVFYQEAYYNLRRAQDVIDYFYKAKDIYPYYPKMYELALEVFLDFDQYEDAKGILNQAKEMNVESIKLDLLEVKWHRLVSEDEESRKKAYDFATDIKNKFEKMETSNEDMADLNGEIARCCHNMDNLEEALKYVESARKLQDKKEYDWIKGNILLDLDEYKKALECYLVCEEVWNNSEMLSERIAYCYKSLEVGDYYENYKKSYEYYKKTLEINPDNIRATDAMVDVCRYLYNRRYEEVYFKEAIEYNNKLIEMDEKNIFHHYNTRGRTYMDARMWGLSLADFDKAIELEPENFVPYMNIGCIYKYTEQFEEALKEFEKAAQYMNGEPVSLKVYGNYGDCYERMGNREKAIECYMKNRELFPKHKGTIEDIIDLYLEMGQCSNAMDILEKSFEKNSEDYLNKKGDIYLDMGNLAKAIYCYKKILAQNKGSEAAYESLGNVYLYKKGNYKKAIKMYEKRLENLEDLDDCRETWEYILHAYYLMGMYKEGKKYYDLYIEEINKHKGGLEVYLCDSPYSAARLYIMASISLFIGDVKNAEHYTERLRKQKKCKSCTYKECHELNLMEGLLLEHKGEREKAIAFFKRAKEQTPNSLLANMMIKKLEK